MKLIDTVQLATTTPDGYGDRTVTVLTATAALFIQRAGAEHNQNAEDTTSDAAVYLDPKNAVVAANIDELEGKLIEAEGGWYRIEHVTIGRRKLLTNAVDNIYCILQKEAGVPYATNVS